MNFLDYIGEVFLWLVLFWLVLKLIETYLKAKNEALNKELEALKDKIQHKFIHVNIEKHGDVFYLFNKDTDEFVAQGATMEEIKLRCEQRYKNLIVVCDNDVLENIGLK